MAQKPEITFSYRDDGTLLDSDNKCYELLDGEITTVPSPTTYHQSLGVLTLGDSGFEMVGVHGRAETPKSPLLRDLAINGSEISES